MGWFNKSTETPVQQFGAPSGMSGYGMQNTMMQGGGMGMGMGMDPMQMQMMGQNPMMQTMANDPVMATARLLQYNDPIASFIQTTQMGVLMDLLGEVITLSLKDFFTNVSFVTDEAGKMSIDAASLPSNLVSMSPENIRLTMQSLQTACMQQTQMNQQQIQMLLAAHNPLLSGQQQPGFFGSLLGGLVGQHMHQNPGMLAAGTAAVL